MQEPLPDTPGSASAGFGPVGRGLLLLCKVGSVLGGLIFVALVVMSIVSIVGRKLASAPVPGDLELMQMGSAVGAAAFFAYCHMTRNDVKVDFFTQNLPERASRRLDAVGALLLAAMCALLSWRTSVGALSVREAGETSMILDLPMWWAYASLAPGLALTALVALVQAARCWRGAPLVEGAR